MHPITPLSFIRTMTVGSGIAPDLLTLRKTKGARGLGPKAHTAGGEFHPALRTCLPNRRNRLTIERDQKCINSKSI